jgi:hypothetical protein
LVSLPCEDALRSIHAAEYFDERLHGGRIGGMMEEYSAEVVAKCTSGAIASAVDLALLSAGLAGEVALDAGAGQADRPRIGTA